MTRLDIDNEGTTMNTDVPVVPVFDVCMECMEKFERGTILEHDCPKKPWKNQERNPK